MGDQESNAVLSKDELDAALAEIESLTPGDGDIPDLSDGTEAPKEIVPIPVPTPAVARSPAADDGGAEADGPAQPTAATKDRPATADRPPSPPSGPSSATATDKQPTGLFARLLSWLPFGHGGESAAPAKDTGPVKEPSQPDAGQLNLVYRILDTALTLINRPFTGLSPEARQAVGLVGAATIVVSLLAVLLLPHLVPRSDALSFLSDRCAESLVAPADATDDASP